MKRFAILGLILVVLIGAIACKQDKSIAISVPSDLSVSSTRPEINVPGVRLVGGPGIITYDLLPDISSPFGSNVDIKLTFKNSDSEVVIIDQYPPQIFISSSVTPGGQSIGRSFPAGTQQLRMQPGESKEYILNWDQKNDNGQPVSYGLYVVGMILNSFRESGTSRHNVSPLVTRVLVLPPDGALERTIEVNQSKTISDVTATLEKIEMSTQKNVVYFSTSSPDYNAELFRRSGKDLGYRFEYKIDDKEWSPLLKKYDAFYDNVIGNVWDLSPIPKSAQDIYFRINIKIDPVSPIDLEFKVPLH
jgi:hypothetical protein